MTTLAEAEAVEPAIMDAHTLDLLGFDKVRELLAGYAASSLGRDLARQIEPSTDVAAIRPNCPSRPKWSPPSAWASRRRSAGCTMSAAGPPGRHRHDAHGRATPRSRRDPDCTGAIYRYRMRLDEQLAGLIELLAGIEDLGTVGKSIGGCIDGRGHVLDMASRDLAAVRQKLADLDEKVKAEISRLLRDPELRKILSYPNATVNGDHYVLPVAVNHRHKVPGVVHRTSSTGETVFIEPASIAGLSAERVRLKADEDREVKRVLRRLSGEVGRVAKPLCYALDVIAQLDLITAKARFSRDFDMYPPDVNTEGRLWLRSARHPLLEHLFRNERRETDHDAEPSLDPTHHSTLTNLHAQGRADRRPPRHRLQPARHHRAEHRRQNGHAQDDRPALPDGPVRDAHPGGRGQPGPGLPAHPGRHRRRAEPGTIAQHVQLAHLADRHHLRDRRRRQPGAARRTRRRHRPDRRGGPGPGHPRPARQASAAGRW